MKLLLILLQFTFMTYNVENLFDTRHDTLKNDYEYTSEGSKRWSDGRMRSKIHQVMQVISGLEELPALVGLCEVENDSVLEWMTTGLYARLGYGYVHHEGRDPRGIDVALLYRKELFVVDTTALVYMGSLPREMLYVRGRLRGGVVLHLMQVHLPSRRGGSVATEGLRCEAMRFMREMVDSIMGVDSLANVLIMGDFNDTPGDRSVSGVLRARGVRESLTEGDLTECELYNLAAGLHEEGRGTYFHQGGWSMLDQIIVSGAMLTGCSGIRLACEAEIYAPRWLLCEDGRPKRTYLGDFYQGGVSDHLPLLVKCR